MHEYLRLRVIYRKFKSSNILLDENTNSKISNFGMARMVQINQDRRCTNIIAGTWYVLNYYLYFFGKIYFLLQKNITILVFISNKNLLRIYLSLKYFMFLNYNKTCPMKAHMGSDFFNDV